MRTPYYYYKRPGDWLWRPHETSSLAVDVRSGRISANWKYRVAGDADEHSLAELLEAEHAHRIRPRTPAEKQMLAPDMFGTCLVAAGLLLPGLCTVGALAAMHLYNRGHTSAESLRCLVLVFLLASPLTLCASVAGTLYSWRRFAGSIRWIFVGCGALGVMAAGYFIFLLVAFWRMGPINPG